MKKITLEELKNYDGVSGPAYVAYKGKVYDVSDSPLWIDGLHGDEHEAGKDLTQEMADAPHGDDMLDGYPVVGELE